jgi:hypothetical protein
VENLQPLSGSNVYELTALGRSLEPVIVALSRWGTRFLSGPREDDDLRAGWAAVAMRSVLGPGAVGGRPGTYEFRIDGEAFHLRVGAGEEGERVEVRQGSVPDPDVVVTADVETLLAVVSGRLGQEEALESGALRVEADLLYPRCGNELLHTSSFHPVRANEDSAYRRPSRRVLA